MAKSNIKSKSGFTIIEVVLVLAIAGLIFLMVFVALPALQRSQRDTQRRDDLARVSTAITQYQTNNKGSLPSASDNTSFVTNYLGGDEFVDPDGTSYTVSFIEGNSIGEGGPANEYGNSYTINIYKSAKCDGEKAVKAGNSRAYAVVYKLEGAGTYCADNGGTEATTPVVEAGS